MEQIGEYRGCKLYQCSDGIIEAHLTTDVETYKYIGKDGGYEWQHPKSSERIVTGTSDIDEAHHIIDLRLSKRPKPKEVDDPAQRDIFQVIQEQEDFFNGKKG